MGIFIYNAWQSARTVPIPLKPSRGSNIFATLDSLASDYWITTPCGPPSIAWAKVTKERASHALIYYSHQTLRSHNDGTNAINLIGDILFVKLDNGDVVDVTDEDIVEILNDIDHLV
jgi:hypothetical protein